MSRSITNEHQEKLQKLIYSEDFKNVLQGLELLESVTENENDLYIVFDLIDKVPYNLDQLFERIFYCKHRNYIKVWILSTLPEYKVDRLVPS